jgi:hypothetical protein
MFSGIRNLEFGIVGCTGYSPDYAESKTYDLKGLSGYSTA